MMIHNSLMIDCHHRRFFFAANAIVVYVIDASRVDGAAAARKNRANGMVAPIKSTARESSS
jgi:hypothetical protein